MKKIFAVAFVLFIANLWALAHSFVIPTGARAIAEERGRSGGIHLPRLVTVEMAKNDARRPEVKITFFDIGQGDAAYVQFPGGVDMLIDCAADARILAALGRVMKPLDRTLDYMIVSHPHADHYAGCIDVLKRFEVRHIVDSGMRRDGDPLWRSYWEAVEAEGADYKEAADDASWRIGEVGIRLLGAGSHTPTPSSSPRLASRAERASGRGSNLAEAQKEGSDINNASVVLLLEYGNSSALFTGDIERERESALLAAYPDLRADILKVSHHGSGGSTGPAFVESVSPKHAIISVGAKNDYGHPSLRVIRRLERVGADVWRTDEADDVVATLDAGGVAVQYR